MTRHRNGTQFTLRQLLAGVTLFAILLSVATTRPLLYGVLAGTWVAIGSFLLTSPAILLLPPDSRKDATESARVLAYCSSRRIGAILLGLLVGIFVGLIEFLKT